VAAKRLWNLKTLCGASTFLGLGQPLKGDVEAGRRRGGCSDVVDALMLFFSGVKDVEKLMANVLHLCSNCYEVNQEACRSDLKFSVRVWHSPAHVVNMSVKVTKHTCP